jgi:hypothetical protein
MMQPQATCASPDCPMRRSPGCSARRCPRGARALVLYGGLECRPGPVVGRAERLGQFGAVVGQVLLEEGRDCGGGLLAACEAGRAAGAFEQLIQSERAEAQGDAHEGSPASSSVPPRGRMSSAGRLRTAARAAKDGARTGRHSGRLARTGVCRAGNGNEPEPSRQEVHPRNETSLERYHRQRRPRVEDPDRRRRRPRLLPSRLQPWLPPLVQSRLPPQLPPVGQVKRPRPSHGRA